MRPYTSHFIFSLVDKYQIPIHHSNPAEFSDECYFSFCTEYIKQCKRRDIHLKDHLAENSSLFRTFLPWRSDAFNTIFQMQWYYDELVIYDPIFFEISDFKTGLLEDDKRKLRSILILLNTLKDSINEGFLLFGSYDSFSKGSKQIEENKYENLLALPDFREECDKLVQVYKITNKEGIEKSYYNIGSMYRDKTTLFTVFQDSEKIKTPDGLFSINYDFVGSSYTLMSIEDAKKEGFYDRAYNCYKEDYSNEITEVLNYIDIGESINTPILFNRKLDELILSNISQQDINKSKSNEYYKFFLPYVNGIPPKKLFDVRNKMPAAFLDFRATMFEIIFDLQKSGVEPEFLDLKIQQKVQSLLKKLDVEMKNTLTATKIFGIGTPLITITGTFVLSHFGINIEKYANLLFGGVAATELATLVKYITEKRQGKSNSLYYLWSAKQ